MGGQPFLYLCVFASLRESLFGGLGVFARGRVREEERTDPESGDPRREFVALTPPAVGVLHTPTDHEPRITGHFPLAVPPSPPYNIALEQRP